MKTEDLFQAILKGSHREIEQAFNSVIGEKLKTAIEVRKVGLTSKIFNDTVTEAVQAKDFVKGGSTAVKMSDVDSLIGSIYDDNTLTKSLIKNAVYREGENNPKKKNPYKKDTADFHLYELGQQAELSRS